MKILKKSITPIVLLFIYVISLSNFFCIEGTDINSGGFHFETANFKIPLWFNTGKMLVAKSICVENTLLGAFIFRWFPLALIVLSAVEKSGKNIYWGLLLIYGIWFILSALAGHCASGAYIQFFGIVIATFLMAWLDPTSTEITSSESKN